MLHQVASCLSFIVDHRTSRTNSQFFSSSGARMFVRVVS